MLVLFLLMGVVYSFIKADDVRKDMVKHGYPEHTILPLTIVEIACVVIYAIPQTSVLGAILLTGYFGGAVATHVRVDEREWWMAVVAGVIAWLGLLLREPRLKGLLPLRR